MMTIGAVAKKASLTVDAIRFYERSALLPHPPRSEGGFRQYAENDVETLRFIRLVQGLGFTLKEVRELVELRRSSSQPCAPVRRRLEQKLSFVERKLADLRHVESELRSALRRCRGEVKKRSTHCPLLSGASPRKARGAR